jgi:hypothetical protein
MYPYLTCMSSSPLSGFTLVYFDHPQNTLPTLIIHNKGWFAGMCDPVIDEHFRRSLGKDYMSLFSSDSSTTSNSNTNSNSNSSITVTGLSGKQSYLHTIQGDSLDTGPRVITLNGNTVSQILCHCQQISFFTVLGSI